MVLAEAGGGLTIVAQFSDLEKMEWMFPVLPRSPRGGGGERLKRKRRKQNYYGRYAQLFIQPENPDRGKGSSRVNDVGKQMKRDQQTCLLFLGDDSGADQITTNYRVTSGRSECTEPSSVPIEPAAGDRPKNERKNEKPTPDSWKRGRCFSQKPQKNKMTTLTGRKEALRDVRDPELL